MQVVGHCAKCGAPYWFAESFWMGVTPPPVTPTCGCWNIPKIITTTSAELRIDTTDDTTADGE